MCLELSLLTHIFREVWGQGNLVPLLEEVVHAKSVLIEVAFKSP